MIVDYLGKAIITLPFWYLFFRLLAQKSIKFKLAIHFITWPAFVAIWFYSNHAILKLLHWNYLYGSSIIWDIYIPSLFYFLQFAIFHMYDYWTQSEKHKEKEKLLMSIAYQSEISALKAQIQPHFLFNTLNSISASVPIQLEKTRVLIARLADTFRYGLQASEEEWIFLHRELDFIVTYMELEKERFKDRLTFSCTVDDSLRNVFVPPMLLQPIIENAIKHGIAPSINGGHISIDINKHHQKMQISICDTGVGYPEELNKKIFTKGIGLRNTSQRIEKLYNETLLIEKNKPSGLKISFAIPIV
ncbi:sensor histidine kinase [Chitinophaga sp. HK235]|uniref:sensor histidine kinase n=1 Tax=Chitinophaga sp. HK235 TaxID=2952571 RepID=UPI001BA49518|nr:histidine kinase [Chitinophaga sp. HK235]